MLEVESSGDIRSEIISLIRQDLRVHMLYLMPRHKSFVFDKAWLAAQTSLETAEVSVITSRLLQIGFWTITAEGGVALANPAPNLVGGEEGDMTVPEYMTLATQILSELSEKGSCWYEFEMLATTQELKKEFLKKVFSAIQELKEKSAKVPSDTMVAWTNVSLEVLGPKKGN
jgi:hypothetical protein